MTDSIEKKKLIIKEQRKMILEMIEASWDLAEQLGPHPLRKGCNCIKCVKKRKDLLKGPHEWKFIL